MAIHTEFRPELAQFPGQMQITVLDPDGNPAPGAQVHVRLGEEKIDMATDEQGVCRVDLPDEQPTLFYINATMPGCIPLQAEWLSRLQLDPAPAEFTLKLEKGTAIGGIVVNEEGHPVSGARVSVLMSPINANERVKYRIIDLAVTTDEHGRWCCDQMPPMITDTWFRVSHPDYERVGEHTFNMTPPPIDKLRDMTSVITIRQGVNVEIYIFDQEGRPIQGAEVFIDDFGDKTGEDGRYNVDKVRAGRCRLTVQAPNHAVHVDFISIFEGMKPIEVRLGASCTLSGRVVDRDGKPIEGASVSSARLGRGDARGLWSATTDQDGRFSWENVPEGEVMVNIMKEGYAHEFMKTRLRTGTENIVTLHEIMTVSGRIVDRATGAPIDKFKIVPVLHWRNGGKFLDRRHAIRGEAGEFRIPLDRTDADFSLRIEAEGYRPAMSPVYKVGAEESAVFNAELEAAANIAGRVVGPDGAPAKAAQVMIATRTQSAQISNGIVNQPEQALLRETDADGRFELPPQIEPYVIVALNEQGCAEIAQQDFEKDPTIQLKAWSHVEGRVVQDGAPMGEVDLHLRPIELHDPEQPQIHRFTSARSNSQGRFEMLRVAPGPVSVMPFVHFSLEAALVSAESVPIVAEPGATHVVNFGEDGCAVSGRLVASQSVDWKYALNFLVRNAPGIELPREIAALGFDAAQGWNESWVGTMEGQCFLQTLHHHFVKIAADGSFIIHGVRPGHYSLAFRIYENPNGGCLVTPIATKLVDVEVSEGDGAVDLGEISIEIHQPAEENNPAPDFKFQTLDGHEKSLGDFRGRVVLLDFWATWCSSCIAEMPRLKDLHERYHDKGLTIVSLSLDPQMKHPRQFMSEHRYEWEQGFVGDWNETKLPEIYGISHIPAMILIDRNGILVAKHVRPDELKKAIEDALNK